MTATSTIIGITGASGSGKSEFAGLLLESLCERHTNGDVAILHEDSYFLRRDGLTPEQRALINYDHPDALEHDLLIEHLHQLRSGLPVQVPQYDFEKHNRTEQLTELAPPEVLILEGFMLLHDPRLRDLLDLKICMDVPLDICLYRRIQRDVLQRGRTLESVLGQYESTVRPMYFEFIEPAKQHADLVVPGGGQNRNALHVLRNHLHAILPEN